MTTRRCADDCLRRGFVVFNRLMIVLWRLGLGPLLRQVLIASGFATMLAGINPYTIDDRSLDLATSTYRLICIRRTAARTGSGGPSDLAWVWLLLTGVVFLWLLCRRRGSSWMHVAHDQEMCRKEVASGCLCRHPLVAYGGVH